MSIINQADAVYQNKRFAVNDKPWDIGVVSTPLKTYFDQLINKNISILVPGCGNAYEAAYLLQNGFTHITLIDISRVITEQLEEKFRPWLNKELTIINGDFFQLKGQYDLIVEQTFFCAITPSLRASYCIQIHQLLKPGGKLAGLLFNRSFEKSGPPFGGDIQEYRELFTPLFDIRTLQPCYNSIAPRAGNECFIILQTTATTR